MPHLITDYFHTLCDSPCVLAWNATASAVAAGSLPPSKALAKERIKLGKPFFLLPCCVLQAN
jgi:hypothetical protein